MSMNRSLSWRFRAAQDEMRNVDGLQPQESFDELLKYLFFKEHDEGVGKQVVIADATLPPAEVSRVAAEIRGRFTLYVARSKVAPASWTRDGFCLSDLAVAKVHSVFHGIWLLALGLDLRGSALKEFLSGPVRKGLGIFLTPDEVVREIVRALDPKPGERILDPACGSGTFLVEAARHTVKHRGGVGASVFAIDKNPRMALLAEFNCSHLGGVTFECAVADSLQSFDRQPDWLRPGSFDLILTNPPFGVSTDARGYDFEGYRTCVDGKGSPLRVQDSEIMFLERALTLLKPGGQLGIVLPRSVLTNQRYELARKRLAEAGAVTAIVSLPPETFAATGTQTTTVVLIVEKYGVALAASGTVRPVFVKIDNVGFDSTGRARQGSQLEGLGESIARAISSGVPDGPVQILGEVPAAATFNVLAEILASRSDGNSAASGLRLADLIDLATTGSTPPRSSYSAQGLFLVKVGNLTGAGISWVPRDRNFVSDYNRVLKGAKLERLLRKGDLVLTSSAHSSKYIARKVDVITSIPKAVGGRASFVGEVMLLRPKAEVDPFLLLAYLRSETVVESIQDRVRGQTAHLHPKDMLELPIDESLLNSGDMAALADLLREEAELNDRLNDVAFRQAQLRQSLGEKPSYLETVA